MNIQLKTINFIIDSLENVSNPLAEELKKLTPLKLYHKFFVNFRTGSNDNPKGLSLTSFGYNVMCDYFKFYEIKLEEGYKLGVKDLLYLDSTATMPYFVKTIDNKTQPPSFSTKIYFSEVGLSIMLKMADGKVSNLRDIQIR